MPLGSSVPADADGDSPPEQKVPIILQRRQVSEHQARDIGGVDGTKVTAAGGMREDAGGETPYCRLYGQSTSMSAKGCYRHLASEATLPVRSLQARLSGSKTPRDSRQDR